MSKEAGFRATRGVRAGRFSRWPAVRIPAPGRASARTPLHINGNPPWERRLPPRQRSDARPISAPRVPHPTPSLRRVAPRPRTTLRAEGRGRRRGAGRGGGGSGARGGEGVLARLGEVSGVVTETRQYGGDRPRPLAEEPPNTR